MAKILVADDNSNIQKMVGLALKDHGIDVVAVGNGEAAVRKISDVRPDLILADVFMPVRNGYEVCKFVKEDSALSHIPVILLVGAFDPLDEQEAQRVGADGVLKKPFVPPDPLISMVKSALVRAGVPHSGFNPVSEVPAETTPEPPARIPTPVPLPKVELLAPETESFVEEIPARPAALKIESGSQPLAFGSLLDPTSPEPAEDLQNIPTVHPELVQERDWRALEAEEEEGESPEDTGSSWRRDGGVDRLSDEAVPAANDWRSQGPSTRSASHERWTPTREKQDLTEAAEVPETLTAVVTETSSVAPAASFTSNAWAAAIGVASEDETVVVEPEKDTAAPEPPIPEVTADHIDRTYVEPERIADPAAKDEAPAPAAVETEQPSAASSWFSTAPSPWDAEALKASQLASAWETAAAPPTLETSTNEPPPISTPVEPSRAAEEIEVAPESTASVINETAIEAVREEVSQTEPESREMGTSDHSAERVREKLEDVDIDSVVAKVLARMKPEVLQEVTREILKPVVEAIVREELSSHKQ